MKMIKKMKIVLIFCVCLLAAKFSYSKFKYTFIQKTPHTRLPADNSLSQPQLLPGETWTPTDSENANQITQILSDSLDKRTNGASLMKRDAHPKHHGCLKANFEVHSLNLPPSLQVGIFSKENQKSFKAWIRFSNGDPDSTKADQDGDVRGMAIKLMNVAGSASGSQDLLLMNSKSFFIKDSSEYLDLMESVDSTLTLGWFFVTHARDRQVLLSARGMKVANPLDVNYFSATPYRLGNSSMKFSAQPCANGRIAEAYPTNPTHNFLRENMVRSISKNEACFDFFIQPNLNNETMPIENPTVEWNEAQSPFIKVASIHIPVQTGSDSTKSMSYCENLSFDPWHTLPEQRPMGAVNRVRKVAYSVISKKRHLYNNIPQAEPTNFEME